MTPTPTSPVRHLIIGVPGLDLDASTKSLLDRGVGGVILFSRNVESPEQVAELVEAIKSYAQRPVVVGVDQEGGRVARLRDGFTELPSMRSLGEAGNVRKAQAVGAVIGRELRAVGIDVAFAPVLDVDTNPQNPVIGDRALSSEAKVVAELGVAIALGIQSAGVAACGKHFPGHGDTHVDSHQALPRLTHDQARLDEIELVPFREAVANDIASLMTSHIVFEAIDPARPATVSSAVIDRLLRKRMCFDRIVFSDCMQMKAIADHLGTVEATLAAVSAGVDWVLISHDHAIAHTASDRLNQAAASGELVQSVLMESAARMDRFCDAFVRGPQRPVDLSVLDCEEHRLVVDRLLAAARGSDPTEQLGR